MHLRSVDFVLVATSLSASTQLLRSWMWHWTPPDWFREPGVKELSGQRFAELGIPNSYDVVLMAGNVPAFLTDEGSRHAFTEVRALLKPGGFFAVGTSSHVRGSPVDQDLAAERVGLAFRQRFSDWHLGQYFSDSAWSVTVFVAPGEATGFDIPDGIFILH